MFSELSIQLEKAEDGLLAGTGNKTFLPRVPTAVDLVDVFFLVVSTSLEVMSRFPGYAWYSTVILLHGSMGRILEACGRSVTPVACWGG